MVSSLSSKAASDVAEVEYLNQLRNIEVDEVFRSSNQATKAMQSSAHLHVVSLCSNQVCMHQIFDGMKFQLQMRSNLGMQGPKLACWLEEQVCDQRLDCTPSSALGARLVLSVWEPSTHAKLACLTKLEQN